MSTARICPILLACLLGICLSSRLVAQVIPARNLFVQETFSSMKLSPDGRFVASQSFRKGLHRVEVFQPRGNQIKEVFAVSNSGLGTIRSLDWIDPDTLVVDFFNTSGEHNHVLIDVEIEDGQITFDREIVKARGHIVDPLPREEDRVIYAFRQSGKKGGYHVFQARLDCIDRSRCRFGEMLNQGMTEGAVYWPDMQHRVRISVTFKDEVFSLYYFDTDEKSWMRFKRFNIKRGHFKPLGFLGENRIAVISNLGRDRNVLLEWNLKTGKVVREIMSLDQGEILNAHIDQEKGTVYSVRIMAGGRVRTRYLAAADQEFKKATDKVFPGKDVFVVSSSLNGNDLLLFVTAADNPGAIYHYQKSTRSVRPIMDLLDRIKPEQMSRNILFKQVTREGYELDAFLTLPKAKQEHYPLIVMPHGGPIGVADADIFQRDVQFFASRGYAVLRVNYSGSYGYGKKFMDRGKGQFGKRIEDEINQVVEAVKAKYPIKPGNSCIIGGSYGGYSALMSVIRFPDQYRCAVSCFGVMDIPLLLSANNVVKHKQIRQAILDVVGEPGPNSANHIAVSPVYLADKVNVPVLLMAGKGDLIADVEQSHRMHYRLKKHNKQSQLVVYPWSGHGHNNWKDDIHMYVTVDAFLRMHLDVPMPESADECALLMQEWSAAGTAFYNGERVEKNDELASQLLKQSSSEGSAEALFNLGYVYEHGEGSQRDEAKAVQMYQKASDQGYLKATYRLAQAYGNGELGLAKKVDKMIKLATQAAEQGYQKAQYFLALAYFDGNGVPKDLDRAREWLEKLAEEDGEFQERASKLLETLSR